MFFRNLSGSNSYALCINSYDAGSHHLSLMVAETPFHHIGEREVYLCVQYPNYLHLQE